MMSRSHLPATPDHPEIDIKEIIIVIIIIIIVIFF